MSRRRLILITGMSGAGKTTLAGLFNGRGYRVVTMGDIIRGIALEKGLEPSHENLGAIAREIRKEGGEMAVAARCVEELRKMAEHRLAVDGIRSMAEVEAFGEFFDVVLVAVHASPETRYRRLRGRARSDDPSDREAFRIRDLRELGFGLGWAIALSDHMVVNAGTLKEFERAFGLLFERLGGK